MPSERRPSQPSGEQQPFGGGANAPCPDKRPVHGPPLQSGDAGVTWFTRLDRLCDPLGATLGLIEGMFTEVPESEARRQGIELVREELVFDRQVDEGYRDDRRENEPTAPEGDWDGRALRHLLVVWYQQALTIHTHRRILENNPAAAAELKISSESIAREAAYWRGLHRAVQILDGHLSLG